MWCPDEEPWWDKKQLGMVEWDKMEVGGEKHRLLFQAAALVDQVSSNVKQ